ncbi:minor capsid protein [Magnetospirillum fulvum]|uniref:Phage head morphogenesis protein n=1 Tax=Magnetospirillum fulvum MGU-K5 TaxID=1316936 RepID=S9S9A9_MAGFU|nr:minor capsid protein [Magnetospirillum fulvum]EPY00613.1 phage head morphogenesis protein [Magnetospirillum fulvum MGU-K5]
MLTPDDILLRHALRLDGLAGHTLALIAADIAAALETVEAEIRRRAPDDAPFSLARLLALRVELLTLQRALGEAVEGRIADALAATIETTSPAVAGALKALEPLAVQAGAASFTVRFIDVDPQLLAKAADVPHDGMSWTRWGRKLADDVMNRVTSELRQGASLGETFPQLRKRLEVVDEMGRTSAERLARTAINATGNRARMAVYEANSGPDGVVKGWRFLATLDSRTSRQCSALSGSAWRFDDPNAPRPPRHPSCRSVALPLLRTFREMGIDLDEAPTGEQASQFGPVSADLSYEQWLRRQSAAFQKEVLGDTRYRAWKNGLPLTAFATYDAPLSIEALRRLYPTEMGA